MFNLLCHFVCALSGIFYNLWFTIIYKTRICYNAGNNFVCCNTWGRIVRKLNYIPSDLEMFGHYLHYRFFSFYIKAVRYFRREHQFRGSLNKRIRSSAFKQSINLVRKQRHYCSERHHVSSRKLLQRNSYILISKQWKYMSSFHVATH